MFYLRPERTSVTDAGTYSHALIIASYDTPNLEEPIDQIEVAILDEQGRSSPTTSVRLPAEPTD